MEEATWNSLEIVKVIIALITPLIGGIIAWRLARIGKEVERRQWADRKIIEKRLEIYEKLVPALNDLYCFYLYVGNWKELTPPEIVKHKRMLDKNFHIYAHLFERDILSVYNDFIHHCFSTYTGVGQDAKLKSDPAKRAKHMPEWKTEWNEWFIPEQATSHDELRESYDSLLALFKSELALQPK